MKQLEGAGTLLFYAELFVSFHQKWNDHRAYKE